MFNNFKNYIFRLSFLALIVSITVSCSESGLGDLNLTEVETAQAFSIENNRLIVDSGDQLAELIGNLNDMSPDEYIAWAQSNSFESARLLWELTIKDEEAIDDHFTRLVEEKGEDFWPSDEDLVSDFYRRGEALLLFKEFGDEEEGKFWHYNFTQVEMASVLNLNRQIQIGDKVWTYALDHFKIEDLDGGNEEIIPEYGFTSNGYKMSQTEGGRTEINNTWIWFDKAGNGWQHFSNTKHRVRAWIEGSTSCSGSAKYISNRLRMQYEIKKWNKWRKRSLTIYDTNNLEWTADWGGIEYYNLSSLPYPVQSAVPPVHEAPLQSSGRMNDATFLLYPHINGYYSGISCLNGDHFTGTTVPPNQHVLINGYALDFRLSQ